MSEQFFGQTRAWMAVILAAAIFFSFALACGMPFAAVGALAALTLPLREAVLFAGLGWVANQVVGFVFLGYPFDVMTLAWGVALGTSAFAAAMAAHFALRYVAGGSTLEKRFATFLAAWAAQQGTVLVWSFVLGGTTSAFAPAVVWFILWTNALAFVVLLGVQFLGALAGVARPPHGQGA